MSRRRKQNQHKAVATPALQTGPAPWPMIVLPALMFVLALLVWQGSFAGTFVFDDANGIVTNPRIRQLWPLTPTRPVANFTFALNYYFGRLDTFGYHVVNLAIHFLAALTMFDLLRRTLLVERFGQRFHGSAVWLAAAVASIWLVHPLQTQSVTYIVQRHESLMGLFYLLTLYCVVRGATSGQGAAWYPAAVCACILGGGCKAVIATAPVVVFFYDVLFLSGSFVQAVRRRWGLYAALLAATGVTIYLTLPRGVLGVAKGTVTVGFSVEGYTWLEYLRTQAGVILHYLRLCVAPVGLCLDHDWPKASWGAAIVPGLVVLALLGLTVWGIVRRNPWAFLGVWFFGILAPTSSVVPVKDPIFEHRMYLSLGAVVALVVLGMFAAAQRQHTRRGWSREAMCAAGGVLCLLVISLLGYGTHRRNAVYRSEIDVWKNVAERYEKSVRAWTNLGGEYWAQRKWRLALDAYDKGLELAPDRATLYANRGVVYEDMAKQAKQPQYTELLKRALKEYGIAIEKDPAAFNAYMYRGNVLASLGRFDEAEASFKEALARKPGEIMALKNYAFMLARVKRYDEARQRYQQVLDRLPQDAGARIGLARIERDLGHLEGAIAQYEAILERDDRNAEAWYRLGNARREQSRLQEALRCFRKAVAVEPMYAEAHNNIGQVLGTLGRGAESVAAYKRAVKIAPTRVVAQFNLGSALFAQGRFEACVRPLTLATKLKPDMAEAHRKLGLALVKLGRNQDAVAPLEAYLRLVPGDDKTRRILATLGGAEAIAP